MEQRARQHCVYILKTGKNLYKIGKTRHLQQRLSAYHTHLPILFKVVRVYECPPGATMDELEEALHIVFQHRRIKGEWFQLTDQELVICDNVARHYALSKLQDRARAQRQQAEVTVGVDNDPLLPIIEANEKYLHDYSRVAEDIKLGLTIDEIEELHEGAVSKATIQTVRRLLQYQTPNSTFLSEHMHIVHELQAGATEDRIIAKYPGSVTRTSIRMIRRILRHQLY